jgi:hypothetical protein
MHLRLPKPLHGWRAFLGEVGIIVLGVLIALAAQQAVESFQWRAEVDDARKAMAIELSDAIGQSYERERLSPCIERRLDTISRILTRASQTGRLPPVGMIGKPLNRTWVDSAWRSTISGQTASHFSRHELNQLGYIYDYVENARHGSEQELLAWTDLQSISGPGRPISSDEVSQLIRDVERARTWDTHISTSSAYMRELAKRVALPYDQQTIKESSWQATSSHYCDPIVTNGPAEYGHSSLEGAAKIAQRSPFTIH